MSRKNDSLQKSSVWADSWKQLKQNHAAIAGLVILILLIIASIAAPWLTSYSYEQMDLELGASKPSVEHWLSTDISGRDLDEDFHELVEVTEKTFLIKNTPKDPDAVEFAYYSTLIDRESSIATEVKYYNSKDYNYRSYEALSVEEIDGFSTVTSARMSDFRNQRVTFIQFYKIAYALDIPENIFTERYLRKPPRNLF